ncbi:MAG: hypothetical protein HC896_14775 [Bacteroidales bacterium]|nr:hypothetical protein [Bacteroidales bacterium]
MYGADDAISVSAPTDLYAGQTYQVTVEYSADAERQVSAYLFNTSSWVLYGSASTTVSAGSGSVTLNVTIGGAPQGTSYQWTGKVEETNGNQLDQVSQWCQVLFTPSNGEVSVSADFNSLQGRKTNKRTLGLNVFQGFNPDVAGTREQPITRTISMPCNLCTSATIAGK